MTDRFPVGMPQYEWNAFINVLPTKISIIAGGRIENLNRHRIGPTSRPANTLINTTGTSTSGGNSITITDGFVSLLNLVHDLPRLDFSAGDSCGDGVGGGYAH